MSPNDAVQPVAVDQPQAPSGFSPVQQDAYSTAPEKKTTGKATAPDASNHKVSDASIEVLTPDAVRALNTLFLNLLNVCHDDKIDRAALIKELQQSQFGPDVKLALNDCAKLLQNSVSAPLQALIERGLDLPPGVPVVMPRDISGRAVGDQLLREEILAGKLPLNFAASFEHAPSAEDVNKLFAAGLWSTDALRLLSSASLHYQVDQLSEKIRAFNPKDANGVGPRDKWLPADNLTDAQREQWLYAAAPWTQTMMEVRNYAETIANLNKATNDASSKFRISELGNKLFPDEALQDGIFPGKVDRYRSSDVVVVGANGFPIHYAADHVVSSNKEQVVVRDDNGQQHTYKQSDVKKMSEGEIVSIHFDLPDTLDRTPANLAKMQKMQDWLDKYSGPVNQAFQEIVKGCTQDGRILLWGDAPAEGETKDHKKFNLVEHRFSAEPVTVTTTDGKQEERIRVSGQVQKQYATWASYQGWGVVHDIGEPSRTGVSTLNGTDLKAGTETFIGGDGTTVGADAGNKAASVKVDEAGGVSIKATDAQPGIYVNGLQIPKDQWILLNPTDKVSLGPDHPLNLNVDVRLYKPDDWVTIMQNGRMQIMQAKDLQAWANEAKAWHYGEKILSTAMDVGMVLTGTIELRAAWMAAGKVATEVATKELLEQAGKTAVTEALEGAGEQTARAAFKDTLAQALRSGAFYKALWHGGFYGLGGLGRQAIINGGDTVGGWLGDPNLGSQIETGRNLLMMADLTWNNTFIGAGGKKLLGLEQAGNAEKVVKSYIDAKTTASWVKNAYNWTHSGLGWLQIGLGADVGYNHGIELLDKFNQLDSNQILTTVVGQLGNPYDPTAKTSGPTIFNLADDSTRTKVDMFANAAAAVRILPDTDPQKVQLVSQLGDAFANGSNSDKLAAAYALMSLSKPGADGQRPAVLSAGHDDRPDVKLQDVKAFLDNYTPLEVDLLNSDLRKKYDAAAAEVDVVKSKPDNDFTKVREIEKLTAAFLDSDNSDNKLVAALALVRLQRRPDGSLPETIGHRFKDKGLTEPLKYDEVENFLHSYKLRNLSAMDKQSDTMVQQRMLEVADVSKQDRPHQLKYIQDLSQVFSDKSSGADDKLAAATALLALNKNGDQSGDAIVGGFTDAQGKMHVVTREDLHKFVDSYANLALTEQLGNYTKGMDLSDRPGLVKATQDAMVLSPDDPARQAQVTKLADAYLDEASTEDEKTAAAIGLLLLGRSQTNGSIPDFLGTGKHLDSDSNEEVINVATKDVFAYLRERSRTAESAGTRLAAGDMLVRCNQTDLTEYGSICQNILRDNKVPADQKMAALFDPHGMRLGEIVNLLKNSVEPAAEKSQHAKQNYESESFGCDSKALESTLHAIIRDPSQDRNVRAMAGMVLRIADIDDQTERKRLQDAAQKAWADAKDSTDPNAFVKNLISSLETDLRSQDSSPEGKKRRISAALLLSDIIDGNNVAGGSTSLPGDQGTRTAGGGGSTIALSATKQEIDDTLLSGMRGATSQPAIALRVLPLLLERMSGMSDAQQQSLLSATDFILKMPVSADAAGSADKTKLQAAVIKDLPLLFAGRSADQINNECDVLKRLVTAGDRLFASDARVRAQAVETFAQMASNDTASQSFLKGIITGAAADASPAVRLAALITLQKFHPDDIHDFCLKLLSQDKDPQVLKSARAFEYADRQVDENAPDYRKQFEIARKEMIDSATQDLSGVLDQIDQRYPLLNGANLRKRQLDLHIAEYFEGVCGFLNWATSRQKTIDAHELASKRQVFDEMNGQFQQLASQAQQNSEQGHQARQILTYILLSNGRPFMAGSSHESDSTNAQANPPVLSDRTWAVQAAAKALLEVSKSADPQVQKDAANMMVLSLTSQPTMSRDIRQQVLQAFMNLHPGEPGSPISKEHAGLAILSALQQELANCPKSKDEPDYVASQQLQIALLDAYKHFESPLGLPVLAAIAGDAALSSDPSKITVAGAATPQAVHKAAGDYPMPAVQAEASAIINELRQRGAVISADTWGLTDQQKYETAKAELMRGGQRQIDGMSADWFAANGYELLDSRRLPQEETQALDAAKPGFFEWLTSSSDEIDSKYSKALQDLFTRVDQQLTKLEDAAKQVPADTTSSGSIAAARNALCYIILSNGDPFSDRDRSAATVRAAGTIYDICKSQGPKAADLDWMLKEALVNHPELPAKTREILAKALSWRVSDPASDGKVPQGSMSREQAAGIYAAALETEYSNMPQPGKPGFADSESLQKIYLEMLQGYKCRAVYPALEAMAQVSPSNELMRMATRTLTQLRDGMDPLLIETVPDKRSSPEAAANELDNELHFAKTPEDKCRAILRLAPIESMAVLSADSKDPRIAILHSALSDNNERVRLTAAYCLMMSQNADIQTDAIVVLNDIALNGSRAGYRQDAKELLDTERQIISADRWHNSIEPKFQEAIQRRAETDRKKQAARKQEFSGLANDLETAQSADTQQLKALRDQIDTVSRLAQDDPKRTALRQELSNLFYSGDPQSKLIAARGLLALAKPEDDVVGTKPASAMFVHSSLPNPFVTQSLYPNLSGADWAGNDNPLLRMSGGRNQNPFMPLTGPDQLDGTDWLVPRPSTVGGGGISPNGFDYSAWRNPIPTEQDGTTRSGHGFSSTSWLSENSLGRGGTAGSGNHGSSANHWLSSNVSGKGGKFPDLSRSHLGFAPDDLNITRQEVEEFIASRADQINQRVQSIKNLPVGNVVRQQNLEDLEHTFRTVTTPPEMVAAAKGLLQLKTDAAGKQPAVLTSTEVSLTANANQAAANSMLPKALRIPDFKHPSAVDATINSNMPSLSEFEFPGLHLDTQTAKLYRDWLSGTGLPLQIAKLKQMPAEDPQRVRCEQYLLMTLQSSADPAEKVLAARSLMALAPATKGKIELFPGVTGSIDIPPVGPGWSTRVRVEMGKDGLPHCFIETPTASVQQYLNQQGGDLLRGIAATNSSEKSLMIEQCARVFVESRQPENRIAAAIGLLSLNANDDDNTMPYVLGSDDVVIYQPFLGVSHKTVSPQDVYSFLNQQLQSHTMLSFVAAQGLMDAHRMTKDEFYSLCEAVEGDANAPADARKRAAEALAQVHPLLTK